MTEALPADMVERFAHFSDCKLYRFWLMRQLNLMSRRRLLAMMMNPSRADAFKGDPTTTVMTGFGKRLGFGRYGAVNMDPTIQTDSRKLVLVSDEIWQTNLEAIKMALDWVDAEPGGCIITAWGCHSWLDNRMEQIFELLSGRTLFRFAENKDGSPRFPRAIRRNTELEEWAL